MLAVIWGVDTKNKGNKSKNKQGRLTKQRSFCTAKGVINQVKRQP